MLSDDVAIQMDKVTKRFKHITVLENISFKIKFGKRTVILGPSGCGKTTILRLIAGFEDVDEGSIFINGAEASAKRKTLAPNRRNIGMVFQDLALWPHMKVRENISFAIDGKGIIKEKKEKKLDEILETVNLSKYKDSYPHTLSGGERQRVAIARAIVSKPKILLMDEPLVNLDLLIKEELEKVIVNIQKDFKITLVYVTHNQFEAKIVGEDLIIINEGKLIESGKLCDIFDNPNKEFTKKFLKVIKT